VNRLFAHRVCLPQVARFNECHRSCRAERVSGRDANSAELFH
jgi:hypothetical protein